MQPGLYFMNKLGTNKQQLFKFLQFASCTHTRLHTFIAMHERESTRVLLVSHAYTLRKKLNIFTLVFQQKNSLSVLKG